MARRKKEQRRRQVPRPALSLKPAILATIVAVVVAAILLSLAVIAIRQDGPVGLVWIGVYVQHSCAHRPPATSSCGSRCAR